MSVIMITEHCSMRRLHSTPVAPWLRFAGLLPLVPYDKNSCLEFLSKHERVEKSQGIGFCSPELIRISQLPDPQMSLSFENAMP